MISYLNQILKSCIRSNKFLIQTWTSMQGEALSFSKKVSGSVEEVKTFWISWTEYKPSGLLLHMDKLDFPARASERHHENEKKRVPQTRDQQTNCWAWIRLFDLSPPWLPHLWQMMRLLEELKTTDPRVLWLVHVVWRGGVTGKIV